MDKVNGEKLDGDVSAEVPVHDCSKEPEKSEDVEPKIVEKPKRKRKAADVDVQPSGASNKGEKKPKSKAKAKSVKAKDSEMAAKKGAGEEIEAEKPEGSKDSKPKTFARRNRPKTEFGGLKWDTLQKVFNDRIRPSVSSQSTHQDRVWFNQVGSPATYFLELNKFKQFIFCILFFRLGRHKQ